MKQKVTYQEFLAQQAKNQEGTVSWYLQRRIEDSEKPGARKLGRSHQYVLVQAQPRKDARIFPYNEKSCGAAFRDACRKLGIKDLRLHDQRHEAISRLFEQGYNVPEVAKVSLHRNPALLLKVYTNLRPEDLHKGPAAKRAAQVALPS
jgi:integrase